MALDHKLAKDRAARLLRKQGSRSSLISSTDIVHNDRPQKMDSDSTVSSVSYRDNPGQDYHFRAPVKYENTFQLEPTKKFPHSTVKSIIKESMENLLSDEHYRPDFCRDVTKTLSELSGLSDPKMAVAESWPGYSLMCLSGDVKFQYWFHTPRKAWNLERGRRAQNKSTPWRCHFGTSSDSTVSSVSYRDNPGQDYHFRAPVKYENTFQLEPTKKFPHSTVKSIIKESMENLLSDEHYRPDFCRDVTKTLSETIKARIKSLMIPRYKIICLVQIGELRSQGIRVGSRCLWDESNDTFWTHEFRNQSIYAVASVYGIYYE